MGAAFNGNRFEVRDTSGDAISGQTLGADFKTKALDPDGMNKLGLMVEVTAKTGTPTVDPKIEVSFDKGTTWVAMPAAPNTETQAQLSQISDTGTHYRFWEVCIDPQFTRIRANFDGSYTSSDDFTYGDCWWVTQDYANA